MKRETISKFKDRIFSTNVTINFLLWLAILFILVPFVTNFFPNHSNQFMSLIWWCWFIFSIFNSLRIIFFLISHWNLSKILHKNIIIIILQVLFPVPFVSHFFGMNFNSVLTIYFGFFFLLYLCFGLIVNFKKWVLQIAQSIKSYEFNYLIRWFISFFISLIIPALILGLTVGAMGSVNMYLWIFYNTLALTCSVIIMYLLLSYLWNIFKLLRSFFETSYDFVYWKLISFYKFKNFSLLDQIFLFVSYIYPPLNIKYVNHLLRTDHEWDLQKFLLQNFSNELIYSKYFEKLTEILELYPEIKKDFRVDHLSEKIVKLGETRFLEYLINENYFLYSIWSDGLQDHDLMVSKFNQRGLQKCAGMGTFNSKIQNYIKREILEVRNQKNILRKADFIEFLDEKIDETKNSFTFRLFGWFLKTLVIISGLMIPIISFWGSNITSFLQDKGINIPNVIGLYMGSSNSSEALKKLELEFKHNTYINSDTWYNFVHNTTNYVFYASMIIMLLVFVGFILFWLNQTLKVKIKQLTVIKNYLKYSGNK